ncbi:chemotaxis protein CheA [Candidatus Sulfurimonas marisnigri]|uniref:Chemotaxis protein CheA n=1 Tax=Candidatus Sulfurimonas marisnigri TaxID=2740405 RepID=A0A7S7M2F3_9BACT|nr:chemotaxis protein CheA [Candidatus Sulfurimonas marisnigri]QOY55780.1 chemotaxis protein CheA [Candidatus Sulfurimonas marisnigri]
MTKEQIRDIFIEEATEIIEKLDVDIINFEDNPQDKDLLNELFRGVHTLKGSANSFGFTRLGEFVHHFEDVLDYYRNTNDIVNPQNIDLFLSSVDIIKDVMWREVDGNEGVPDNFNNILEGIKSILSQSTVGSKVEHADLAIDFSEQAKVIKSNFSEEDIIRMKSTLNYGEELYHISLTLDDDIFFRGFDHARLFKLLSDEGQILESWWNMDDIPTLDELNPERSSIKHVDVFFASDKPSSEIEELFEYIDEHEYSFVHVEKDVEKKPEPEPLRDEDIKFGRREIDNEVKTSGRRANDRDDTKAGVGRRKNDARSFVKVDTTKLDELFDSIGEMVIAQNFLAENEEIKKIKSEGITKTINVLSKITRLIQNRVMSLRMVAVSDTFEKMKRVARDASKKVNKEISLEIYGADTEIDKTMVDALSDPLIHIMRNAIDHGLEDCTEDRIAVDKTAIGIIGLRAFHRGGNIAIEVSDDGRGINRDKVFSKAVERGLIEEDDDLTDAQVFSLIMQAGFSTADVISDISGRGVGLDVVRSSIEKLHGRVEIASEVGKGSTFTILLPLTLAIIDGMIVKSAGDTFIIPTLSVVESFIPSKEIVHSIKRKGEFVDLRGEMIPVVRLNHVLEIGEAKPNIWESTLMCVESEKGKYAILVDDLVGRQQVVIKSLGSTLSRIKELSGSAIMGSGEIALILNVEELLIQGCIK